MFGGEEDAADNAAVAEIEAILSAASIPSAEPAQPLGGVAWFCACETLVDCPTWVITDGTVPGALSWQRMPEPSPTGLLRRRRPRSVNDMVDPEQIVVWGHVSPQGLRDWMRGGDGEIGNVDGDPAAVERLRRLCIR